MPTFDIPKLYNDGEDLYEAHLDAAFEYIEGALNTTKLDSSNLQTGAVVADTIASGAVTEGKISSGAISTTKIADTAITGAKLNSGVVDATTIEIAESKLRVKDGAITTAKIASGAITTALLPAANTALSASSGAFAPNLNTFGTPTADACSISHTASGTRPILVDVVPDGTGNYSFIELYTYGVLSIMRDDTVIARLDYKNSTTGATNTAQHPVGSFRAYEASPVAGAHTYKLRMSFMDLSNGGGTVGRVHYAKVLVREL